MLTNFFCDVYPTFRAWLPFAPMAAPTQTLCFLPQNRFSSPCQILAELTLLSWPYLMSLPLYFLSLSSHGHISADGTEHSWLSSLPVPYCSKPVCSPLVIPLSTASWPVHSPWSIHCLNNEILSELACKGCRSLPASISVSLSLLLTCFLKWQKVMTLGFPVARVAVVAREILIFDLWVWVIDI